MPDTKSLVCLDRLLTLLHVLPMLRSGCSRFLLHPFFGIMADEEKMV